MWYRKKGRKEKGENKMDWLRTEGGTEERNEVNDKARMWKWREE